jgi:hypothetical protein
MKQIIFFFLLFASLSQSFDFLINNCRAAKFKFNDLTNSWPIYLDYHCHTNKTFYRLTGGQGSLWEGLYEPYGQSLGERRFELVLSNGTVFKLMKHLDKGNNCLWVIIRTNKILLRAKCGADSSHPPEQGWESISGNTSFLIPIIRQEVFHPLPLRTRNLPKETLGLPSFPKKSSEKPEKRVRKFQSHAAADFQIFDETPNNSLLDDEDLLRSMLHPAVGRGLGEALKSRYTSHTDRPVDSIVIDGLFNPTLLSKALEFTEVQISSPYSYFHSSTPFLTHSLSLHPLSLYTLSLSTLSLSTLSSTGSSNKVGGT